MVVVIVCNLYETNKNGSMGTFLFILHGIALIFMLDLREFTHAGRGDFQN